jgi:oligosaccharyltransferase complex subunit gamma
MSTISPNSGSDFHPAFELLSSSWRRKPTYERDQHFFASLDFPDGQAVFSRLGLTTAPTVQFHPALSGPNKGNKLGVVSHDLNRQ